jgi:NitT/TauT family transport system ATP-binding protein
LAGLEQPESGQLRADDVPITGPDPHRMLVFQDPSLYPWRTVWANTALGLEARGVLKQQRGKVTQALQLVGLAGFEKAYPRQFSLAWPSALP